MHSTGAIILNYSRTCTVMIYLLEDIFFSTRTVDQHLQFSAVRNSRFFISLLWFKQVLNFVHFLAERCNCIAKFRYSHKMLSVCRLSVTRVYCDKTTANRITLCFTAKQLRVSTVSMVSLKTKF